MKFRYHNRHGKEIWGRIGQIIPSGSFIDLQPITEDYVIVSRVEAGNPYDEYSRNSYCLAAVPKNKQNYVEEIKI